MRWPDGTSDWGIRVQTLSACSESISSLYPVFHSSESSAANASHHVVGSVSILVMSSSGSSSSMGVQMSSVAVSSSPASGLFALFSACFRLAAAFDSKTARSTRDTCAMPLMIAPLTVGCCSQIGLVMGVNVGEEVILPCSLFPFVDLSSSVSFSPSIPFTSPFIASVGSNSLSASASPDSSCDSINVTSLDITTRPVIGS
ncbi:hypothetical protein K439DRAFT_1512551 [Ramaria rubella]|nr:hypothetical protein K439DRAFT_1512551 [Ramaria rubella]